MLGRQYVSKGVFGSSISYVTCNYVSADGGRGGLPFPDTGYPIPDVDYLCLLCIDFYVWDVVSIFNHLPRMFLSTNFAFRITDWTCCHGPHLHAILRIISRGVSGLATDSPCGVWGRGWTTCLLHDSPLFGSHFKMSWYVSLEWYFIYLLFLASVHGFMYETSDFFYSVITFSYTKCFVHSNTVDVVFTLSYTDASKCFIFTSDKVRFGFYWLWHTCGGSQLLLRNQYKT